MWGAAPSFVRNRIRDTCLYKFFDGIRDLYRWGRCCSCWERHDGTLHIYPTYRWWSWPWALLTSLLLPLFLTGLRPCLLILRGIWTRKHFFCHWLTPPLHSRGVTTARHRVHDHGGITGVSQAFLWYSLLRTLFANGAKTEYVFLLSELVDFDRTCQIDWVSAGLAMAYRGMDEYCRDLRGYISGYAVTWMVLLFCFLFPFFHSCC